MHEIKKNKTRQDKTRGKSQGSSLISLLILRKRAPNGYSIHLPPPNGYSIHYNTQSSHLTGENRKYNTGRVSGMSNGSLLPHGLCLRWHLAHVQSNEFALMQLLPELQLQEEVVVGVELHSLEGPIVIVVGVLLVIGGHEAIGADLG